jgi:hypothetical protein
MILLENSVVAQTLYETYLVLCSTDFDAYYRRISADVIRRC